MNWLEKLILSKQTRQQLEQKAAPIYQPGIRYTIQNGRIVSPADNKTTYIRDGYTVNDIVFSVVGLILDKVRLPYWNLNKIVKESSLKQYEALMARKNLSGKDWKRALKLKEDALEPISNFNLQAGKVKELITYPNEEYIWQDHVTNGCAFKLLTGDSYDYGKPLSLGANTGIPNSIDTLPADLMTIKATDDFPPRASSYELTTFNQKFTKEEILHEKYWNPSWSTSGQQLYGLSPLKAALKNITRNNSAKDAATAKFQNGGIEGIMYTDVDAKDYSGFDGKGQTQAIKQQLAEEYSGPQNQGKIVVSGHKMGFVPLGLSPVDLAIIDSEKWDAVMFCNIYGVPPELLGLVQKTYNNVKEAEKALTTRSAIPLLTSKKNYLNWKFQSDWGLKGQNIYLDYDTECFTELQVDIVEVVNTTSKMIMITPNEEREAVGWESRPEPEADQPWILSAGNRIPLSDYQQNQVDQQLMNDAIQNGTTNTGNAQQNGSASNTANGQSQARMSNGNGKNIQFTKAV